MPQSYIFRAYDAVPFLSERYLTKLEEAMQGKTIFEARTTFLDQRIIFPHKCFDLTKPCKNVSEINEKNQIFIKLVSVYI